MKNSNKLLVYSLIVLFISSISFAQVNLPAPRVSPTAKVGQAVGFANIEINYSRPGVKGREIWGTLVPYGLAPNNFGNGKPMPWRTGANENTTIKLSHDAKINGNNITAGTYSIHMLVHEDQWTIIFNKQINAWGSFFYEQKDDVLRIKSKPVEAPFEEWLKFGFDKLTNASAEVFLHWGKLKVPFTVSFDQHKVTLEFYKDQLTNLAGFNQAAWGTAARYCLTNNVNLDEAMTWIDKALGMQGGNNFNNVTVKAGLLELRGKSAEAKKLVNASMGTATEAQINAYGYQLMGQNKNEEALNIFKLNVSKFPESWNPYDSLGEILNNMGDKKGAIENYEKAYEKAPAAQKARIEGIIKGLK